MIKYSATQRLIFLTVLLSLCLPIRPASAQEPSPTATANNAITAQSTPVPATPDLAPLAPQIDVLLNAKVEAMMTQMEVEDRVGQLFVVEFQGSDVNPDSDIAQLIERYRIGGVVISPRNGNFVNEKGQATPALVAGLTNRLQGLAYGLQVPAENPFIPSDDALNYLASLPTVTDLQIGDSRNALNIPLLVGLEQMGDDLFVTSLRRGFSDLPNQMTIGATWNPELSRQVGMIVGRELRSVGVNLLLGPNLDVITQPRPETIGALGVHSFGGSTYWVTQLGRAYIAGVHAGSNGQVATIARHFPGQGAVDRRPDEEVAVIQDNVQVLRQQALPPFLSVARAPVLPLRLQEDVDITDGFMSSHMRFSGYQGSGPGRVTPLSLSPDLERVLREEGMADWRNAGGIVMSNALGLPAIQRYYEATVSDFPHRQVAMDAFTAGNDLLYLAHFSVDGDWESQQQNVATTISFFQERYNEDPEFANRVDQAVRRILRLKLRLFSDPAQLAEEARVAYVSQPPPGTPDVQGASTPSPTPTLVPPVIDITKPVIPPENVLLPQGTFSLLAEESEHRSGADAAIRQVARESLTLLYSSDLRMPTAPQPGDKLLIFTDIRLEQECDQCMADVTLGPDDLTGIIIRLYGPDATGQVDPALMSSFTFGDLAELLDGAEAQIAPTPGPADPAVASADSAAENPLEAQTDVQTNPATANGELAQSALDEPIPDKMTKLETAIQEANWIIFAMRDVDTDRYPNSDVVKRFLRERSDQLSNVSLVVLSLNAPYFLDATEISRLTAYLGVYSKATVFLENAVRVIFRNSVPNGAPPVSVAGTVFRELSERLQPDPDVLIPLQVSLGDAVIASNTLEGEPPTIDAGATVRVTVGPVSDRNGNPVPDGTAVNFRLIYEGEELALTVEDGLTRGGIVGRDVLLERGGVVQFSATSLEATTGPPVTVSVLAPPAPNTPTPLPVPMGTSGEITTSQALPEDAPAPASGMAGASTDSSRRVNPATLVLAIITITITLAMLLILQVRVLPRTVLVYNMLWAVIVGLGGYILYAVGLIPGADWLFANLGVWAAAIIVFIGMILPLLWLQLRTD